MAFTVVLTAEGLSPDDAARATAVGPPWVATSGRYPDLISQADFVDIAEIDATAHYRQTAADWLGASIEFAEELRRLLGDQEFERILEERQETLAAIDAGLLRRSIFTALVGK